MPSEASPGSGAYEAERGRGGGHACAQRKSRAPPVQCGSRRWRGARQLIRGAQVEPRDQACGLAWQGWGVGLVGGSGGGAAL